VRATRNDVSFRQWLGTNVGVDAVAHWCRSRHGSK
jgi:hypothetical protein